jgi:hypothetical protein
MKNTISPALLAQCFAALQMAEATLNHTGQSGAWTAVMQARIKLQFALEDLPPVPVTPSQIPDFLKVPA